VTKFCFNNYCSSQNSEFLLVVIFVSVNIYTILQPPECSKKIINAHGVDECCVIVAALSRPCVRMSPKADGFTVSDLAPLDIA
jgi:hypothetical protein